MRAAVVAAALGAVVAAGPGARGSDGLEVSVTPAEPRPGDVVLLRVPGAGGVLRGTWDDRPLRWFPAPGGAAALVGVDLERPPGTVVWEVDQEESGRRARGTVVVRHRVFPTQALTLPREQVELDGVTLARVREERARLQAVLAAVSREPLWEGPFRVPVPAGRLTGGFGLRRVLNGQPRDPHAGADWAAPPGTPVLASNAGRVALTGEYFFPGRLVVLDHGLGLFTLYFHLDRILAVPGARVVAGEPVGSVGATGRATGPHLHFAVVLDGARVDPEALLALPLARGAR